MFEYPRYKKEAFRLIGVLTAAVFLVEMGIMFALRYLIHFPANIEAVVDSLLLITLLYPVLYRFVLYPLMKEIRNRIRAEESLRVARDYTDNIIKSMIDTLIVVDPDARIKTINRATSDLLGYKEDELIGKPVATIFAEEEEEEEEEVTPFKGTKMKKLIEEGFLRDYDLTYKTKSGERIPVSFSGSVMRDKGGELVGIVGIARDMREIRRLMEKEKEFAAAAAAAAAEMKRADELARLNEDLQEAKQELAISELRYRKIFETVHAGILVIDAKTEKIINANEVLLDMFNYPSNELMNKKFWEIGIPRPMIEIPLAVQELSGSSGRITHKDVKLKTRDNRELIVDFSYNIYRLGDLNVIQCLFYNVTGRKWMEERLKKLNEQLQANFIKLEAANRALQEVDRLKSDFVSTVSHELRTPLAIVKEGISIVFNETAGSINPDQKKMLGVAKDNIDRLAHIINNLLDISKIEARGFELKRELVALSELVDKILTEFEPLVRSKGLNLKRDFTKEKKIEIFIDKNRIIQVLANLINNALKFTEKGSISVSLKEEPDSIECSVSDTGRGISEEDLPKVFMKFQQFGREAGPGEHGTGLGLAICKGIVELHNGKIWVESHPSRLDKGTRIVFRLPKYSAKDLFKEYIANGLKEAIKEQAPLSVIVFDINNFNTVEERLGKDRVASLVHGLEQLVKNNLRRKADVVIKDTRAILVVLPLTKKEDAAMVMERIRQMFNDYLIKERIGISVDIVSKVTSFPEDGNTNEELLVKIGLEEQDGASRENIGC